MNIPDRETLLAFAKANVAAWERISKTVDEFRGRYAGSPNLDELCAWFESSLRDMAGGEEMYQASKAFLEE